MKVPPLVEAISYSFARNERPPLWGQFTPPILQGMPSNSVGGSTTEGGLHGRMEEDA